MRGKASPMKISKSFPILAGVLLLEFSMSQCMQGADGTLVEPEHFEGVMESGGEDVPPGSLEWFRVPTDRSAGNLSGGYAIVGGAGASAKGQVNLSSSGSYRIWILGGTSTNTTPSIELLIRQSGKEQLVEFLKETEVVESEDSLASGHSSRAWFSGEAELESGDAELELRRPDPLPKASRRIEKIDALFLTPDLEFRPGFEDVKQGGVLEYGR